MLSTVAAIEAKRLKRLALNRKAAQNSRQRKRERIQSLEFAVVNLFHENQELRSLNQGLRRIHAQDNVHSVLLDWVQDMALKTGTPADITHVIASVSGRATAAVGEEIDDTDIGDAGDQGTEPPPPVAPAEHSEAFAEAATQAMGRLAKRQRFDARKSLSIRQVQPAEGDEGDRNPQGAPVHMEGQNGAVDNDEAALPPREALHHRSVNAYSQDPPMQRGHVMLGGSNVVTQNDAVHQDQAALPPRRDVHHRPVNGCSQEASMQRGRMMLGGSDVLPSSMSLQASRYGSDTEPAIPNVFF